MEAHVCLSRTLNISVKTQICNPGLASQSWSVYKLLFLREASLAASLIWCHFSLTKRWTWRCPCAPFHTQPQLSLSPHLTDSLQHPTASPSHLCLTTLLFNIIYYQQYCATYEHWLQMKQDQNRCGSHIQTRLQSTKMPSGLRTIYAKYWLCWFQETTQCQNVVLCFHFLVLKIISTLGYTKRLRIFFKFISQNLKNSVEISQALKNVLSVKSKILVMICFLQTQDGTMVLHA